MKRSAVTLAHRFMAVDPAEFVFEEDDDAEKSFVGHAGRPGQRGGSAPRGEAAREPAQHSWAHPSPKDFIGARDKTTRPGYLSPLEPADLNGHSLFLSSDGKAGVALDAHGDVQNLFNNNGPNAGREALLAAVERGGRTLDCFDGYLPQLYSQAGFVETGRMKFNPEYAPAGWNHARDDSPDVVFMAWKGWPDGKAATRARLLGARTGWRPRVIAKRYYDGAEWDTAKLDARREASAGDGSARKGVALDDLERRADSGGGADGGGAGSGASALAKTFTGHAGRPGERGGSAPRGEAALASWFGNSKVVDSAGKPLVVYHSGTFDPQEDGTPDIGDEGMHFGTKTAAEMRPSGKAMDDFIREATYEQDDDGRWHWSSGSDDDMEDDGFSTREDAQADMERTAQEISENTEDYGDSEKMAPYYLAISNPKRVPDQMGSWAKAVKQAKAEGHDGLVYRNQVEDKGSTSWVAFSPSQIKLAEGNTTFDPKSHDVRKAAKHLPAPKLRAGRSRNAPKVVAAERKLAGVLRRFLKAQAKVVAGHLAAHLKLKLGKGFQGHAGRPGLRGGSAPRGSDPTALGAPEPSRRMWHLTDDPNFKPNPEKGGYSNYGVTPHGTKNLYATEEPDTWGTFMGYKRPYAAEIALDPTAKEGEHYTRTKSVPDYPQEVTIRDQSKAHVARVVPYDEMLRIQEEDRKVNNRWLKNNYDLVRGPTGNWTLRAKPGAGKLAKADEPSDAPQAEASDAAETAVEQEKALIGNALKQLDFKGWTVLMNPTKRILQAVAGYGGNEALADLKIEDDTIFDRMNDGALDYAAQRSAELVGMRVLDDGRVIENPNPKWAITEDTRDMIRAAVEDSIRTGVTRADLSLALERSHAFNEFRADMIARTEISKALIAGNMAGWLASGQVDGKQWVLSNDHDKDDECDENVADGMIPLDETFTSGDQEPPAHPNCSCDVIPYMLPEDEE